MSALRLLVLLGASFGAADQFDGLLSDATWSERTRLHAAAASGDVRAVKALIEAGAPLEVQTDRKATPLYFAAQQGHTEVIMALVKAGA